MEYVIEVKDLVKEFKDKRVLHGVSFRVKRGEVFGLLGPNGAGKTTTIRIILGLLKPTSGKALVFGYSLAEHKELRRKVGVVLEGDGLFLRLSAYENLDFYAKIYGLKDRADRARRIREILELVGLYEVRNMKVGYFSRGMRRRLALARALVHNPEALFLDEPTLGLDVEAQVMVQDVVTKLSREEGVTVLYTSHNLDEVEKICNKVAILAGGRIVALDNVNDLLKRPGGYAIEVCFASTYEAMSACKYLRELGYMLKYERNNEKNSIMVFADPSKVLKDLAKINVEVKEIRRLRRSLRDVYLELVRREI